MPGVMCWVSRHQVSKAVPEADHPGCGTGSPVTGCEALFKDLIWAFSDFARDRRECAIRKPVALPAIPVGSAETARNPISRITPFFINLTEDI